MEICSRLMISCLELCERAYIEVPVDLKDDAARKGKSCKMQMRGMMHGGRGLSLCQWLR